MCLSMYEYLANCAEAISETRDQSLDLGDGVAYNTSAMFRDAQAQCCHLAGDVREIIYSHKVAAKPSSMAITRVCWSCGALGGG